MAVEVFLSDEKIKERVKQLGAQITQDYAGEEVTLVGVLNGSFIFMADLVREIKIPVRLEFMSASSYEGTQSTSNLKINLDLKADVKGKNVLIVEDIVDTGLTVSKLLEEFDTRETKSLKVASLLYKPARLEHKVNIDYLAFEIEDNFVIGYGLDFDGRYRELPYIGIYSND